MKVVEIFESINGEGKKAGEIAVFVRFAGCNLNCSYCDTGWANMPDTEYRQMSEREIYDIIKASGIKNVTLTGGEPLLQDNIKELMTLLCEDGFIETEIETNGSIDIEKYRVSKDRLSFTVDYKTPGSGMEQDMLPCNCENVTENDVVKFVSGSTEDLERAYEIIKRYGLDVRTNVHISPVFGKIEAEDIVEFLKRRRLNNVRISLQLHKYIWNPDKKGV